MDFGLGSYGLAFLAGLLTSLSPCVLPLIPIVLTTAASEHRWGPVALSLGLASSFALVGTLIASVGFAIGLDQDLLRQFAAVVLIAFAIVLLVPKLQQQFALATSGFSGAGNTFLARIHPQGLTGQFLIGLLLGLVWSPCVGPTLGAAITLASQGQSLVQVGLMMLIFGIGAGLPLVLLGLLSREAMLKLRTKLLNTGKWGKYLLGLLLLFAGVSVLTGLDKHLEAFLVQASPDWLTQLTVQF